MKSSLNLLLIGCLVFLNGCSLVLSKSIDSQEVTRLIDEEIVVVTPAQNVRQLTILVPFFVKSFNDWRARWHEKNADGSTFTDETGIASKSDLSPEFVLLIETLAPLLDKYLQAKLLQIPPL